MQISTLTTEADDFTQPCLCSDYEGNQLLSVGRIKTCRHVGHGVKLLQLPSLHLIYVLFCTVVVVPCETETLV